MNKKYALFLCFLCIASTHAALRVHPRVQRAQVLRRIKKTTYILDRLSSLLVYGYCRERCLSIPKEIQQEFLRFFSQDDFLFLGRCGLVGELTGCSEGNSMSICCGGDYLCFTSYDGIDILNLETGNLAKLTEHMSFRSLCCADGGLFCARLNKTVRWDLEKRIGPKTFSGHTDWVLSLCYGEGKLFTGSRDTKIKIWDVATGACIDTLSGHTDWVTSLCCGDGKLFSASKDREIKVWDPATGTCLKKLIGHKQAIFSVCYGDGKLFAGDNDNISIWDLETGVCIQTLKGADSCLFYFMGKLFASDDNDIRIWDPKTGECLKTLTGHGEKINSICFGGGKLFSLDESGNIKIWGCVQKERVTAKDAFYVPECVQWNCCTIGIVIAAILVGVTSLGLEKFI